MNSTEYPRYLYYGSKKYPVKLPTEPLRYGSERSKENRREDSWALTKLKMQEYKCRCSVEWDLSLLEDVKQQEHGERALKFRDKRCEARHGRRKDTCVRQNEKCQKPHSTPRSLLTPRAIDELIDSFIHVGLTSIVTEIPFIVAPIHTSWILDSIVCLPPATNWPNPKSRKNAIYNSPR